MLGFVSGTSRLNVSKEMSSLPYCDVYQLLPCLQPIDMTVLQRVTHPIRGWVCAISGALQAIAWDKRVEDAAHYLAGTGHPQLLADDAFGPHVR